MDAYPAGQDIFFAVDFAQLMIYDSVDSASYRVLDQSGAELLAETLVDPADLTADGFSVTTTASINALPADAKRALRMVEIKMRSTIGNIVRTIEYVIEAEHVLVAGENSFVGYGDAVMIAYDIPALEGWNNVDRSVRISALLFAKRMIARVVFRDPVARQPIPDLQGISQTDWNALPGDFKQTLARAQVLEANEVCGGDPVVDYRRRGIQSITVGEAKNFLQSWKPSDERTMQSLGISPAAARELKPYLASTTVRIRRG
ncbi:hypothetical protein [Castellaniella sp.]|uniref:hypothetical protein n=1 Tax=Castellaniella sp. TaxID=1955812 RepID=UPI002AFF7963|nr:hypothetical protein [Castellaniella sp.]